MSSYYAVKGFAVVPAQARSLGFQLYLHDDRIPKASKEEAASIGKIPILNMYS